MHYGYEEIWRDIIECRLETGRTHQIRVHMASIGHPLLGDALYGPTKCPYQLQGQTLHAYVLGFIHPSTGEYMEFQAPLPDYFEDLLKSFANHPQDKNKRIKKYEENNCKNLFTVGTCTAYYGIAVQFCCI